MYKKCTYFLGLLHGEKGPKNSGMCNPPFYGQCPKENVLSVMMSSPTLGANNPLKWRIQPTSEYWPPIFEKLLYKGQKSKLLHTYGVTYQNVCKKGTKPKKKEFPQSGLPVKRKIQKTTQKYSFSKKWHFGWFFGYFSLLVSPIEL